MIAKRLLGKMYMHRTMVNILFETIKVKLRIRKEASSESLYISSLKTL